MMNKWSKISWWNKKRRTKNEQLRRRGAPRVLLPGRGACGVLDLGAGVSGSARGCLWAPKGGARATKNVHLVRKMLDFALVLKGIDFTTGTSSSSFFSGDFSKRMKRSGCLGRGRNASREKEAGLGLRSSEFFGKTRMRLFWEYVTWDLFKGGPSPKRRFICEGWLLAFRPCCKRVSFVSQDQTLEVPVRPERRAFWVAPPPCVSLIEADNLGRM